MHKNAQQDHKHSRSSASGLELFERAEELTRLRKDVLERRHSMLVFGEEGAGKTFLLQRLADASGDVLYIPYCKSPTDLLHGIAGAMQVSKIVRKRLSISKVSLRNLKGIVQRALAEHCWILAIDHVQSPSMALAHLAKELNYYGRTPVVFAGRSEHMEDIGNFRTFCTDRASRLELKPWPSSLALEFTRRHAEALSLKADNLEETIHGIAEMSRGYPGPILNMLKMAMLPAYMRDGQIKFHTVWLDYRLRGTGASGNMKPEIKH